MQTTIDLPDDLLARAQELADEPMTPADLAALAVAVFVEVREKQHARRSTPPPDRSTEQSQ